MDVDAAMDLLRRITLDIGGGDIHDGDDDDDGEEKCDNGTATDTFSRPVAILNWPWPVSPTTLSSSCSPR